MQNSNEFVVNKLKINNLKMDRIRVEIADTKDGGVILKFIGNIDMEDPGSIFDPFFDNIHNKMLSLGLRKIYCDLKSLVFLNSSGIRSFVKWIINLKRIEKDKRYIIAILTNKDIIWQISSLSTLLYIAPELVTIN